MQGCVRVKLTLACKIAKCIWRRAICQLWHSNLAMYEALGEAEGNLYWVPDSWYTADTSPLTALTFSP